MKKFSILVLTIGLIFPISVSAGKNPFIIPPEYRNIDSYTIVTKVNLLSDYEPIKSDGTIHAVVEIPAGTNAKWEVTKPDGVLKWEFKKGKPRIVKYLAYPGNYGMVPKTVGGDNDPLDIIILGSALPRGSIVNAKLIGALKLLDDSERDDKLIAVYPNSPLYEVNSLKELDQKFPGITTIVETWFLNYKGPGKIESKGYVDVDKARKILNLAIESFKHGR